MREEECGDGGVAARRRATARPTPALRPSSLPSADPALGRSGLYVPDDVPPAYVALLPHADVVTPNAFEAEALTGVRVSDVASARLAAASLHAAGVATVVVTSVPGGRGDEIDVVASAAGGGAWRAASPRLAGPFTGTGDLFAALLLVGLHRHRGDEKEGLGRALAHAARGVAAVCAVTAAAAGGAAGTDAPAVRARELRLIQCVDLLRAGEFESGGVVVERLPDE